MSLTQFAMVEELACLIKDNLPCKHLVLSIEEALVDFLKDDKSSDGVLELEPMNSYNRLLLHRLADIFGFSHQSVGEGDDRHLIFERCPETSVPSILVTDLLWQYDEIQSPSMSHLLSRRWGASPELEKKRGGGRGSCEIISLEERETAYLAARERIFSMEEQVGPPPRLEKKPQSDPVVARRMIAHALGQKMPPPLLQNTTTDQVVVGEEAALKQEATDKGKTEISQKDHLKEQQQHIGAAKRMFANALGFQPTRHNHHHDALVTKTTKRGSPD